MREQSTGEFVREFHRNLTRWFSGSGARAETWTALLEDTPDECTLVYPSGARLTGAAFLASISDAYGTSPGFVADIQNVEVVATGEGHAVVAYEEHQEKATKSAASNGRSVLAVLINKADGQGFCWRHIQETAMPAASESES